MRTLGTVAVVVGGFLVGCGSSSPGSQPSAVNGDPSLGIEVNQTDTILACPVGGNACFNVSSDHNITHIFVNLGFDGCTPVPFVVSVDGVFVDPKDFHSPSSGPCNGNGERIVPRILWFPLPGNQKNVEVCVLTEFAVPALVAVGAKADDLCNSLTIEERCQNCVQPPQPPDMGVPPDMSCVPPVCQPGTANCNGICEDGCEVNTNTDPNNCGSCGNVCPCEAPNCVCGTCTAN
jgi:hypothetical protein